MNRLRSLLIFLGLMIIPSLVIACGALVKPTPTAVPQPADQSEVPRISPEELKRRLDDGADILVIDTRSSSTYDFGHIPGSVMEPDSFDDIARERQIVTYCS